MNFNIIMDRPTINVNPSKIIKIIVFLYAFLLIYSRDQTTTADLGTKGVPWSQGAKSRYMVYYEVAHIIMIS